MPDESTALPPLPLRQALLPLARLAGLLALVVLALIVWSIRSLPPLATDGLIYHLSVPAFWLQDGFLSRLDFPFQDNLGTRRDMKIDRIAGSEL